MTNAPDLGFRLYSERSRTRHELRFGDMLGALEREMIRLRDLFPRLVARQALSQAEVDRRTRLLAGIVADFRHYDPELDTPPPRDRHEDYFAKVNALRAEIEIERKRQAKGEFRGVAGLAESRRQLELLEAAHDWYWNDAGLDCIAVRGGYEAWADEMDRRNQWMARQHWPLRPGEIEVIVPVYTRVATPREGNGAPWAQVARRFRHHGEAPFTIRENPEQDPPRLEVVNAVGDDALWSPDDYRSLDRAIHGPRHEGWPTTQIRDALERIAAALTKAAELAAEELQAAE